MAVTAPTAKSQRLLHTTKERSAAICPRATPRLSTPLLTPPGGDRKLLGSGNGGMAWQAARAAFGKEAPPPPQQDAATATPSIPLAQPEPAPAPPPHSILGWDEDEILDYISSFPAEEDPPNEANQVVEEEHILDWDPPQPSSSSTTDPTTVDLGASGPTLAFDNSPGAWATALWQCATTVAILLCHLLRHYRDTVAPFYDLESELWARHSRGVSTWNDGVIVVLALVWALGWLLVAVRLCLVVERLGLVFFRAGQRIADSQGL